MKHLNQSTGIFTFTVYSSEKARGWNFRSSNCCFLFIPKFKTDFGSCSLSVAVAVPRLCNSLDGIEKSLNTVFSVLTFRRHLKTYLFNPAYSP